MTDIFISYSSSDRPKAKLLAEALVQQGWSVWWDRNIPPGKPFDEVIEEALDSTKCVIVLWSKSSVSSSWVKTEAAEGAKRGILLPVLIEDAKIPLEFRRIQAADLSGWLKISPDHEFEDFLKAVADKLSETATAEIVHVNHKDDDFKSYASAVELPSEGFVIVNSLTEIVELCKKGHVLLFTYKADWLGSKLMMRTFKSKVLPAVMPLAKGKGIIICFANLEKGFISLSSDLAKQLRNHNLNFEGCFLFQNGEIKISKKRSDVNVSLEEYTKAAQEILRNMK